MVGNVWMFYCIMIVPVIAKDHQEGIVRFLVGRPSRESPTLPAAAPE